MMIAVAYFIKMAELAPRIHSHYQTIRNSGGVSLGGNINAYHLGMLLTYLQSKGIDFLNDEEFSGVMNDLCQREHATHFLLRRRVIERVSGELASFSASEEELTRYYEEFNEEQNPDAGQCMLKWLDELRTLIASNRDFDVLIRIG